MNLTKNRWLLVALGVVLLYFAGDTAYRKLYEEPLGRAEASKAQLTKRLKEAKNRLEESESVARQLESLEQKSLPWNADMARARYQDWLLQLAKDAKLTNTRVDSSDPKSITTAARRGEKPTEIYKKFTFTLNSRGDLKQVTKLLYDFYRGGHLHKISDLRLNPIGNGQEVTLSLTIEALALPHADRETELTSLVSERLAQADVRDYQWIAQRNFFSSGGAASAWKRIQLSAITSDVHGVGEAWFNVGPENKTYILQLGKSLSLPSCELSVVSLDDATATITIDGHLHRLAIGQNLTQATAVE